MIDGSMDLWIDGLMDRSIDGLTNGSIDQSMYWLVDRWTEDLFFITIQYTIKVNVTARYLERCWHATNNDTLLITYLIHTLSLTLSAFYRASNQLIHWTIDPSIHQSIHRLINRSIGQSIDWSSSTLSRSMAQLVVSKGVDMPPIMTHSALPISYTHSL